MYHVSEKTRTKKSARLICEGLGKCLEEKPFDKIRVNDICKRCFVSRATFYRLFDQLVDVLVYECDNIHAEILKMIEKNKISDKTELAITCINIWLSHPTLIKAIVQNHLDYIPFNTYRKNAESLKQIYNIPFTDEQQSDYLISILSSVIFGALSAYFKHGGNDPVEEVYKTVCDCLNIITEAFNS